jgi:hypothetical protein
MSYDVILWRGVALVKENHVRPRSRFDVLALATAYRINKLCKVFHLDEVTSKVSNVCSRELEDLSMRCAALLMLLSSLAVPCALADSFPTYNLTSGTVATTSDINGYTTNVFSFSGPGAVLVGIVGTPNLCFGFAPGGSSCDPSLLLTNSGIPTPMTGSLNGGPTLWLLGGIQMSGSPFLLPNNPSVTTFSITLQVSFSGSFTGCVMVDALNGCFNGSTVNPTIAAFTVNGNGTASLMFVNTGAPAGLSIWQLSQGTYTLNPVPEPATLLLVGTGAAGLLARYKRRRRA